MKRFIMLSVMVLSLGMAGMVHGGTLYLSMTDGMPSVGWYDLDGNYVFMGTFPGPVQDLEFDTVTGDLFALTTIGVVRMTQDRVFTQITTVGATQNAGGDIAIDSTGKFAVSLDDATNIVYLYNSDGTPQDPETVTFSSASFVADIEYDKATDDLYAYTNLGVLKHTGESIPITGAWPAAAGGDMAICSNGWVALSKNDTTAAPAVPVYTLSNTFQSFATIYPNHQDIDFDMNTCDLYLYTNEGIKKWVVGGAVTPVTGAAYPDAGGDLSWAPDWECAEAADCYDDDACTVDDCVCSVDNLCDCNEPTPLVCPSDDNDCTDDLPCDPVDGCVYTCNATGYLDACCLDDACSGEPVCEHPSCFGSTALGE